MERRPWNPDTMEGVAWGAALILLTAGLGAPAGAQEPPVPEALRGLEFLVGSWRAERVEFLDEEGQVVRVSSAEAHNELQLDGRVLAHRGRLDDPRIETRAWYYWDPKEERVHMGSVSSRGRYDEFVGEWRGDRLVMTTLPSPAYGGRLFRMTHRRIGPDAYLETLEVSEDGGESWRTSSRQRMQRVAAADASAILERMDAYTGRWRTEEKRDRRGEAFHYVYDLRWIDPERTIARMRITRRSADGPTLAWEGFKGRGPPGEGVYYVAASPSGRSARGEVVLDGDDLVTLYEGWTADGDAVEIRDVFSPVEDGAFRSRTFLRETPDAEWRRVGGDLWSRIGPSS